MTILCSCGRRAVVRLAYANRSLCPECFRMFFERRFIRTLRRYGMIEQGDRIAVAVSGGKDSLTLYHLLKELEERLRGIEVFAIAVDEGIEGYRDISLEIARREIGEDLRIVSFEDELGFTLDEIVGIRDREYMACAYCGVFRRYLLNRAAREMDATKLATGHNLDDEIQTFLMNIIRNDWERISRLRAAMPRMHPKLVPRIKPLRTSPEKEVALYAMLRNFRVHLGECPYRWEGFRSSIRDFVNSLESKHPGTKFSLLGSLDRALDLIPRKEVRLRECEICGEPTVHKICKACQLKKEIEEKAG